MIDAVVEQHAEDAAALAELREVAAGLLASTNSFRTYVGLAACAMHRVDSGEAFSMITGLDLGEHDLEAAAPPSQPDGPGDDPDDLDVRMDPDEDLPWPDGQSTSVRRIQ